MQKVVQLAVCSVSCQYGLWYCTSFMLVITLQRLVFHVRTPLAIQHFHSLSTLDTPYSLFGLCTGCEQSFCVLLLCYFDIFCGKKKLCLRILFFPPKTIKPSDLKEGGKTS